MPFILAFIATFILFSGSQAVANSPLPEPDPYYLDIKRVIIISNTPQSGARPITFPDGFNIDLAYQSYENVYTRLQEKIGPDVEVLGMDGLLPLKDKISDDTLVIKLSGRVEYKEEEKLAYGGISLNTYRNESAISSVGATGLKRFFMNSAEPCVFQGSTDVKFADDANKCVEILLDYFARRINHY